MMIRSRRLTSLLLAPLALAFASACSQPAAAADPEADLIALLKGADVKGYLFAMNEDPTTSSSALTAAARRSKEPVGKKRGRDFVPGLLSSLACALPDPGQQGRGLFSISSSLVDAELRAERGSGQPPERGECVA